MLNEKQKRFYEEYLVDFNATKAAQRAGYSKKTAYSQAHDLLKKPEGQKYLQVKGKRLAQKLEISQERTMQEIARIAFSDLRKAFNEDGSLKQLSELDDDTAAVLASIEVDEIFGIVKTQKVAIGQTKKIKVWDKTKALEMLAKHYKIFEDAPPPAPVVLNTPFSDKQVDKILSTLRKK
jgi:phage terminase small subunit